MKRTLKPALAFFCFISFAVSNAQQSVQKIITETKYLLYVPPAYNGDTLKRWPLLLFLHGSGESGMDIEKVKTHGPPQLIEQGKRFPFMWSLRNRVYQWAGILTNCTSFFNR